MKIVTLIIAVAQAIPAVDSLLEKILGAWASLQVKRLEGPMLEISKQRKSLIQTPGRTYVRNIKAKKVANEGDFEGRK